MYSELKKEVLRKRKKAIKERIPKEFLALGNHWIDKAIHFRNLSTTKQSSENKGFNRAKGLLLQADQLFDAHLTDRFSSFPNQNLNKKVILTLGKLD